MDIEKIKKLAKEKADKQERRGTSIWTGLYYGFIYGYQACASGNKASNDEKRNEDVMCDG